MAVHVDDFIEDQARKDGSYAIAYALLQIARGQKDTAIAIKNLDLRFIGERLDEGTAAIASAIDRHDG